MNKLLTVPEMLAVERAADAAGHSYAAMLDCAGRSLAGIVEAEFGGRHPKKILALVGSGNNGGDALVAISHLAAVGWDSDFLLVTRESDSLVALAEAAGCRRFDWPPLDSIGLAALLADTTALLDGLLGTGIRLPLRAPVREVLEAVKGTLPHGAAVVAVDTPSGLDCSSGAAAAETLPADLTVAMAAMKTGYFSNPASRLLGRIRVADIGLPSPLRAWDEIRRTVLDAGQVAGWLPARPPDAHKGTFGTVLVAGGSANYPGALLLAGRAAFRSGAGLVTLAAEKTVVAMLAGNFPEATWLPLSGQGGFLDAAAAGELIERLGRATALLVGPGLGLESQVHGFFDTLLAGSCSLPPLVVDADGLKWLSRMPDWPSRLPPDTVLTPHPGEMAILAGRTVAEVQANRLEIAAESAARWGHVVVLKGAYSLIASPDGRMALNPVSTPALARAGTGDVLAGLVAGLRAQGLDAFEAAASATWIHGQAGLAALQAAGSSAAVLAGDVVDRIGSVLGGWSEKSH